MGHDHLVVEPPADRWASEIIRLNVQLMEMRVGLQMARKSGAATRSLERREREVSARVERLWQLRARQCPD